MPENNSETALQKVPASTQLQRQQETFAPRTLSEAIKFGELVSKSGMCPKDYIGKPEAIVVAIQMGMEVGLQPLQALQSIAVINGKPALYGDAALALVKTHPEFEWIKEDDLAAITKNAYAVCIIKRRNQPEVKMTFSMEDAKKASLQGKAGPWSSYPSRMLQMRARGFAIRDAFPDALKGIITAEEAMDMPVTIEGGPLVEQSKPAEADPNELPISIQEAQEVWELAKKNGHVVPLPDSKWDVSAYKKALDEVAHTDSSAKILRKHYAAFRAFIETPAVKQEAAIENPDAEPVEQGQ